MHTGESTVIVHNYVNEDDYIIYRISFDLVGQW